MLLQLPWIQHGPNRVGDSTMIIRYLVGTFGSGAAAVQYPEESTDKAVAIAVERMVSPLLLLAVGVDELLSAMGTVSKACAGAYNAWYFKWGLSSTCSGCFCEGLAWKGDEMVLRWVCLSQANSILADAIIYFRFVNPEVCLVTSTASPAMILWVCYAVKNGKAARNASNASFAWIAG